jgi:hypothetical protein
MLPSARSTRATSSAAPPQTLPGSFGIRTRGASVERSASEPAADPGLSTGGDRGPTAGSRRRRPRPPADRGPTSGTFTGPELNGKLLAGASADSQIVTAVGTALADVRYTLQTDGGELLYSLKASAGAWRRRIVVSGTWLAKRRGPSTPPTRMTSSPFRATSQRSRRRSLRVCTLRRSPGT